MDEKSRPKAAPQDTPASKSRTSIPSAADGSAHLLHGVRPKEWLDSLELVKDDRIEQAIKPATMLVAYAISRHADWQTGRDVFPAHSTIARKTRLNRASVVRHLKVLRELGFVERVDARPGQTDIYRLTIPPWIGNLEVPE